MFTLSERTKGIVSFMPNNPQELPQSYIPGSLAFQSTNNFGDFYYQEVQQKNFTIWRSSYHPHEDVSLRVKRNMEWLGFRLMLKKHIAHVFLGKPIGIMQGQMHFAYSPLTDVELLLKGNEIYEVVDMQVSPALFSQIKLRGRTFDAFSSMIGSDKPVWISEKPAWSDYTVLEGMEELLQDPTKEDIAKEIVQQVVHTLIKNNGHDKKITYDQVENLYLVREMIRKRYPEAMTLQQWAKETRMNTTDFKYKFRQVFGITPYRYLMYERIKAAKQIMLSDPQLPLSEVARQCGFRTYNNLRRAFYPMEKTKLSVWRDKNLGMAFQLLVELMLFDLL
ncbi:AraC family transcriptional regulator [Chitinophaga terrae (ex Kim and Jung 2007)]|jgi:AraC-type DNA-binding domain-containing proteins|uniref:helix-turn-helix domain-containing protein n=1 Tax=Chitinophaga terrae (ex Kim and Jung 2007) TaxID=408074 RepID=UPI00262115D0|nr:AraC family transcriptional regulator [Chitinophaga terrae (ex Kim and Jung 2007)]MDQ0109113.1 AraC-like DNA-binding protein [Chitinophaga terrae (ex Kim and Jung 2007)]